MGLGTLYNSILSSIETQLKTITELADDDGEPRVHIYKENLRVKQGEYEVVVVPDTMAPIEGVTSKGTWNEFIIHCDLLYWRNRTSDTTLKAAFLNGLTVAEKIYDKFHLTNLSGLVKIIRVSINPLQGDIIEKGLEAIPYRVTLRIEQPVLQI